MTATSSSDRYQAARDALAQLETEAGIVPFYRDNLALMMRPEGFIDGNGELFESDAVLHNMGRWAEGMEAGIAALRSLIEPPATEETPESIADSFAKGDGEPFDRVRRWLANDMVTPDEALSLLIQHAYQAGIQAAWESWEPETAPGYEPEADPNTDAALRRVRAFLEEHEAWEGVGSHISTTGEYGTPVRHSLNSADLRVVIVAAERN